MPIERKMKTMTLSRNYRGKRRVSMRSVKKRYIVDQNCTAIAADGVMLRHIERSQRRHGESLKTFVILVRPVQSM